MTTLYIDHMDMPLSVYTAPERDLVASVLRAAVEDLVAPPPRSQRLIIEWRYLRDDAMVWFSSEQTRLYSFLWCCSVLGLEAECVRNRLRRAPQEVWGGLTAGLAGRVRPLRWEPVPVSGISNYACN